MSNNSNWCWNNGSYQDRLSATVSIMDRGFLFGDGVYEVIPCYDGRPFLFGQHLQRLNRSLAAINLALPVSPAELSAICQEVLRRNSAHAQQYLYLQITRGASESRAHCSVDATAPHLVVWSYPWQRPSGALPDTVSLISIPDVRWGRCDIKSINLLANVIARDAAHAAGCDEALFVRDGVAVECSASNIFAITAGKLYTTPPSPSILPGITRQHILGLAKKINLPSVEKENITLEDYYAADESLYLFFLARNC